MRTLGHKTGHLLGWTIGYNNQLSNTVDTHGSTWTDADTWNDNETWEE